MTLCDFENDAIENNVDLTQFNTSILGTQTGVTLTYYNTLEDANTQTNPITTKDIANGTEVFVNLSAPGSCIVVGSIAINLQTSPVVNDIDVIVCDNFTDGEEMYDLTVSNPNIIADTTNHSFQYYTSEVAAINNTGFRSDGSIFYGGNVDDLLEGKGFHTNLLKLVEKGEGRFKFGDSLNPMALVALENLLIFCQNSGIKLVAFLPPVSTNLNQELKNNHSYFSQVFTAISPIFSRYDSEIYDFTNLLEFNSSDNEMIDEIHGGEVVYMKMLIQMLEKESCLNYMTDYKVLMERLKNKENQYLIYNSF